MSTFAPFRTTIAVLPADNIDTDQIMPARFLKGTTKEGLGASLFYDWRFDGDDRERPEFALNSPKARGARVLVAGDNFGCGSSREHAPWGLVDYGFKAVVSTSFADIFHQNALKNGLLPIKVEPGVHQTLLQAGSGAEVVVDLERQALTLPDGREASFPVDLFAKRCLLLGVDELGYLLGFADAVAAYEAARPGRFDTRSLEI